MAELLTALGIMLVLGVGAWYLGSLLLRVAAFWCFVGAGLLLLVAGEGDVSPWAGPALLAWGAACWVARPLPAPPAARLVALASRCPAVLRAAAAPASGDAAGRAPDGHRSRPRSAALSGTLAGQPDDLPTS